MSRGIAQNTTALAPGDSCCRDNSSGRIRNISLEPPPVWAIRLGLGSEAYRQKEQQSARAGGNPCIHTLEGGRPQRRIPALSSELFSEMQRTPLSLNSSSTIKLVCRNPRFLARYRKESASATGDEGAKHRPDSCFVGRTVTITLFQVNNLLHYMRSLMVPEWNREYIPGQSVSHTSGSPIRALSRLYQCAEQITKTPAKHTDSNRSRQPSFTRKAASKQDSYSRTRLCIEAVGKCRVVSRHALPVM